MATKEVMVTAPLVVLLYDRTFLAGSLKQSLRRRWLLYLGLAATWGLLAYLVFSTGLIFRQTALGAPSAWEYARTQPGVILYYLRLSIWPGPLCMDYEWPVAGKGKTDEAIKHYQEALRLQPEHAKARYRLAGALLASGRPHNASEHYHRLLQQMPDSIEALNDLAWLLATQETAADGDPARAVQLAGRFDDAVLTAERAVGLAEAAGQPALARNIRSRLELYRAGRPYRHPENPSP